MHSIARIWNAQRISGRFKISVWLTNGDSKKAASLHGETCSQ